MKTTSVKYIGKLHTGIRSKYRHNYKITSIMFLYIFGLKFTSFLDIILSISLILSLYFLLRKGTYSKIIIHYSFFLFISLIYGLAITVLKGSFDLQFIYRTTRIIINLFGSYSFVYIYKNRYGEFTKNAILKDLEICLLLHALLMFFMYINTNLAFTIYDITGKSTNRGSILLGYRVSGLTYALSQLSVIQMWGGIIVIYNYFYNELVRTKTISFGIKMVLIIFSILVSGRTGMFFGLFLIPLTFFLFVIRGNKKNIRVGIGVLLGVFLVILLLQLISFTSFLPEKFNDYTLMRLGDVFTFVQTGESSVYDQVQGFWTVVPNNTLEFIFGTSSLGRSELLFIDSDPGLNKILFAVGLVGSILYYIPTFYSIIMTIRMMSRERELSIVVLFIIISNFALNFKELAIYTRNQWSIITVLFFLLCNESMNSNKVNLGNSNYKNSKEVLS